jgi:predicted nucleic acid-binding protein
MLAEFYSTTTGKGFLVGGKTVKLTPELAARRASELRSQLSFVELTADDVCAALERQEVTGGRTHDLMHCEAARKAGADVIYTFNTEDFNGISAVKSEHPPVERSS